MADNEPVSLSEFKKQDLAYRHQDEHSRRELRADELARQELVKPPFSSETFAKASDPDKALTLLLPEGETKIVSQSLLTSEDPAERAEEKFKVLDRNAENDPQPEYIGKYLSDRSEALVEEYVKAVMERASNKDQARAELKPALEKLGLRINNSDNPSEIKLEDALLVESFNTEEERKAEEYRLKTYRIAYVLENITSELVKNKNGKANMTPAEKADRARVVQLFTRNLFQDGSMVGNLFHLDNPDDVYDNPRALDSVDMFDGLRYAFDYSYNEYVDWKEAGMERTLEEMNDMAASMSAQLYTRLSGPAGAIYERVQTRRERSSEKQPANSKDIVTGKKGREELEDSFLRDVFLASRYMWTLLPPEFIVEQEKLMNEVNSVNREGRDSQEVRLEIQAKKRALFEHQQLGRLVLMRNMGLSDPELIIKALVEDNPNHDPKNDAKMRTYVEAFLEDHKDEIKGYSQYTSDRIRRWGGNNYGNLLKERLGEIMQALPAVAPAEARGIIELAFNRDDYSQEDYQQQMANQLSQIHDEDTRNIVKRLVNQAQRYRQDEVNQRAVNQDTFVMEYAEVAQQLGLPEADAQRLKQELVTLAVSERFSHRKFGKNAKGGNTLSEQVWSYLRNERGGGNRNDQETGNYPLLSELATRIESYRAEAKHAAEQGDRSKLDMLSKLETQLMRIASGRDQGVWERVSRGNSLGEMNPRQNQQDALKGFAYLFTAQATEVLPDSEQTKDRYGVVIVEDLKKGGKRGEVEKKGKNLSIRPLKTGEVPKSIEVVKDEAGGTIDDPNQGLFYEYQSTVDTTSGTGSASGESGEQPEPPASVEATTSGAAAPDLAAAPAKTARPEAGSWVEVLDPNNEPPKPSEPPAAPAAEVAPPNDQEPAAVAEPPAEPAVATEPVPVEPPAAEPLAESAATVESAEPVAAVEPSEEPADENLESAVQPTPEQLRNRKMAAYLGILDYDDKPESLKEWVNSRAFMERATDGQERLVYTITNLSVTPEDLDTVQALGGLLENGEVVISTLELRAPSDGKKAISINLDSLHPNNLSISGSEQDQWNENTIRIANAQGKSLDSLNIVGSHVKVTIVETGLNIGEIRVEPGNQLNLDYGELDDRKKLANALVKVEGNSAVQFAHLGTELDLTLRVGEHKLKVEGGKLVAETQVAIPTPEPPTPIPTAETSEPPVAATSDEAAPLAPEEPEVIDLDKKAEQDAALEHANLRLGAEAYAQEYTLDELEELLRVKQEELSRVQQGEALSDNQDGEFLLGEVPSEQIEMAIKLRQEADEQKEKEKAEQGGLGRRILNKLNPRKWFRRSGDQSPQPEPPVVEQPEASEPVDDDEDAEQPVEWTVKAGDGVGEEALSASPAKHISSKPSEVEARNTGRVPDFLQNRVTVSQPPASPAGPTPPPTRPVPAAVPVASTAAPVVAPMAESDTAPDQELRTTVEPPKAEVAVPTSWQRAMEEAVAQQRQAEASEAVVSEGEKSELKGPADESLQELQKQLEEKFGVVAEASGDYVTLRSTANELRDQVEHTDDPTRRKELQEELDLMEHALEIMPKPAQLYYGEAFLESSETVRQELRMLQEAIESIQRDIEAGENYPDEEVYLSNLQKQRDALLKYQKDQGWDQEPGALIPPPGYTEQPAPEQDELPDWLTDHENVTPEGEFPIEDVTVDTLGLEDVDLRLTLTHDWKHDPDSRYNLDNLESVDRYLDLFTGLNRSLTPQEQQEYNLLKRWRELKFSEGVRSEVPKEVEDETPDWLKGLLKPPSEQTDQEFLNDAYDRRSLADPAWVSGEIGKLEDYPDWLQDETTRRKLRALKDLQANQAAQAQVPAESEGPATETLEEASKPINESAAQIAATAALPVEGEQPELEVPSSPYISIDDSSRSVEERARFHFPPTWLQNEATVQQAIDDQRAHADDSSAPDDARELARRKMALLEQYLQVLRDKAKSEQSDDDLIDSGGMLG